MARAREWLGRIFLWKREHDPLAQDDQVLARKLRERVEQIRAQDQQTNPYREPQQRKEAMNQQEEKAGQGNPLLPQFHILQYFEYEHLPPELREIAVRFWHQAHWIAENMPLPITNMAEAAAGLRKLLEAKDCIVRATLPAREASPAEPPTGPADRRGLESDLDYALRRLNDNHDFNVISYEGGLDFLIERKINDGSRHLALVAPTPDIAVAGAEEFRRKIEKMGTIEMPVYDKDLWMLRWSDGTILRFLVAGDQHALTGPLYSTVYLHLVGQWTEWEDNLNRIFFALREIDGVKPRGAYSR